MLIMTNITKKIEERMNDMQKLGKFLAEKFDRLGDIKKLIAEYEAKIAELEAQLNKDNGGTTTK